MRQTLMNDSLIIDEKRQQLIDCKQHLLVLGGPGSGKTTIALRKAFEHIQNKGLRDGQKLLFVSFSRNARARIEESIHDFTEFRDFWSGLKVETFHSFFFSILKTHGYLVGMKSPISIILPHEEKAINGSLKKDQRQQEYDRLMREEGRITFDKFAHLVFKILSKSKRLTQLIAKCYPVIFIDEVQDTDLLQWSILKHFKDFSQLVCLGDLDQQIFDYRDEVDPERIENIKTDLLPLEIDLTNDNYRNPKNDIRLCASHIKDSLGFQQYQSVDIIKYAPAGESKNNTILQALERMYKRLKAQEVENPSICFLCTYNLGTTMVSKALVKKQIPHELSFDQTSAIYSGLLISCLLEPIVNDNLHLERIFKILEEHFLAKNNSNEAGKYSKWIEQLRDSQLRSSKGTKFWYNLLSKISQHNFSGVPKTDWVYIRNLLINSPVKSISDFAKNSNLLFAFQAGKKLNELLVNHWIEKRSYIDAQSLFQQATSHAQLEKKHHRLTGIHVMTVYKAKGKEFDGVILFQNNHHSPIDRYTNDSLLHARKVFFVAVTRAKRHVSIMLQHGANCQIFHKKD